MARDINADELRNFVAEGLSPIEIARRTGIPRSTVRRRLKTLGVPEVDTPVNSGSKREVYKRTPQLAKPTEAQNDLQEILAWWRARKQALQTEQTHRETQRQTYHVEKQFIEAIKRTADLEGVSIMEIVNRAFKQFFQGGA